MLTYKGYIPHIEFDDEAEIFHGNIINTRDVITFQGTTIPELKKAFVESVDDYLDFCAKRNEEPDKPFSGKFNLRIDPSLHRKVYVMAKQRHLSLNTVVCEAISEYLISK